MAISIEDFRKSLNVGLSRDLVQKILTKYENFDFSNFLSVFEIHARK